MTNTKDLKNRISQIGNPFSSKLVCYLFPFVVLGGNLAFCLLNNDINATNGYYMIHYLYTYDHGFVSRGLVGEIISWFSDTVSENTIQTVMIIFAFLLMIAGSLCIGKALSCVRNDPERFNAVFLIVVVFYMLAMPFDFYYEDCKLDKLLWALTLLAVFLSDNKITIWFVPVLCAVATLVNPVFVFCSMILIAIILLQKFHSENYAVKNGILCGITYLAIIAIALLAPISEKWLGFETPAELIDFYFARYEGVLDEKTYGLFETEWLFDYFEPLDEIIRLAYEIYFVEWSNGLRTAICFIALALPSYICLGTFWKTAIRSEENKMQKFIYFLCAVSPVVMLPSVLISWEFSKYFYNNLLAQTGLIVFFIANGNPAVLQTTEKVKTFCKNNLLFTLCAAMYLLTAIATFASR